MKKLLIATGNPAKFNDYKTWMVDLGIEVLSLNDLTISHEVDETGDTFKENALKKAKEYAEISGIPTLSDDAGLEVDYLNGEPGVASRTWLGYRMTDQQMIDELLERLSGVPLEQRTAKFVAVVALVFPDGTSFNSRGEERGYITETVSEVLVEGYPYNSIFKSSLDAPFRSELSAEDFKKCNHRNRALLEIKKVIVEELQK